MPNVTSPEMDWSFVLVSPIKLSLVKVTWLMQNNRKHASVSSNGPHVKVVLTNRFPYNFTCRKLDRLKGDAYSRMRLQADVFFFFLLI